MKMAPLFWKWSSVGQIWFQIEKLIFLENGDGGAWGVQVIHPQPLMCTLLPRAAPTLGLVTDSVFCTVARAIVTVSRGRGGLRRR